MRSDVLIVCTIEHCRRTWARSYRYTLLAAASPATATAFAAVSAAPTVATTAAATAVATASATAAATAAAAATLELGFRFGAAVVEGRFVVFVFYFTWTNAAAPPRFGRQHTPGAGRFDRPLEAGARWQPLIRWSNSVVLF